MTPIQLPSITPTFVVNGKTYAVAVTMSSGLSTVTNIALYVKVAEGGFLTATTIAVYADKGILDEIKARGGPVGFFAWLKAEILKVLSAFFKPTVVTDPTTIEEAFGVVDNFLSQLKISVTDGTVKVE